MKSDILKADLMTGRIAPQAVISADATKQPPERMPRHMMWLLALSASITKYDRDNARTVICRLMEAEARLATARRLAVEEKFGCSTWHRSTRQEAAIARGMM